MKGTVLYVSRAGFPDTAAGMRISEIAKILHKIGYAVHFISELSCDDLECSDYKIITSSSDEVCYELNDFTYSFRKSKETNKLKALKELILAEDIFCRIRAVCNQENVTHIILYNEPYGITRKLQKFCNLKGIKLYADVTEWYQISGKKGPLNKLLAVSVNLRIMFVDRKLNGIIAVSNYLENYYNNKNNNVLFVPPLCGQFSTNNTYVNQPIKFVYAGSPGLKDMLIPFIDAVKKINIDEIQVEFNIIGIRKSDLGLDDSELKGIVFHGRLPHEDTINIVRGSDFGILLRHNKKYAKAGFSTKLVECMANGIPMICNRVGGSDSIIKAWKNGIVIDDCDVSTIKKVLLAIIGTDPQKLIEMKIAAYKTATELFMSDSYAESIDSLLMR